MSDSSASSGTARTYGGGMLYARARTNVGEPAAPRRKILHVLRGAGVARGLCGHRVFGAPLPNPKAFLESGWRICKVCLGIAGRVGDKTVGAPGSDA